MTAASGTSARLILLKLAMMLCFAVLAIQLWRLQVVGVEGYLSAADANRYRVVSVEASRGVVYDQSGTILAQNSPRYTVSIVPSALPEDEASARAVLERLAQWLNTPLSSGASSPQQTLTPADIELVVQQYTGSPHSPVAIVTNVDRHVALVIEEDHLHLPGVVLEIQSQRDYPLGSLMSHLLGFVGPIPVDEVQSYLSRSDADYVASDNVGLVGVEASYEALLRGRKGQKHVEVDAYEREVQVLATDPPVAGSNLVLSVDAELQRAAETALMDGMRRVGSTAGVVVAMNPRDGRILAMVSLPSYDNNLFSSGISSEEYAELVEDVDRPLVNHAISGQYPPGSTYKIVPAAGGLEEGVLTSETRLRCRGALLLPNKYYPNDLTLAQKFVCWAPAGHGSLSLTGGLAYSCDVFFYQVGGGLDEFQGLGVEKLASYSSAFGLGKPTGVDLVGEADGLVPDEQWKRINYGEAWTTGDTYNASIGQGFVLVTPLQLLNAMAAVANGGNVYVPQVVHRVTDANGHVVRGFAPRLVGTVPVSSSNLVLVQQGLRYAISNGTGSRANLAEVAVAGKTGTAEYFGPKDDKGNLPTHAWFVAYAPYDDPQIAIVVFVSSGHEGARIAAPVAAQILRAYFGIPQVPSEDIVGPAPGD